MKFQWNFISITAVLVLILTACAPAVTPSPTEVEVATEAATEAVPVIVTVEAPLVVTAKKVTSLPTLDGNAGDGQWKDAPALQAGVLTMKAVYTGDDLAMLMVWQDRDLSINTRATWNWDPGKGAWWKTGIDKGVEWESFAGRRHPEWINVAFDISSKVEGEGCNAFCHEYPPGSGIWHHQTDTKGEYVDSWFLLAKHGYGPNYYQDQGWLNGVKGVTQEGELQFDIADEMDSHQLLNGSVTFLGYAEDKVMASPDDPKFSDRDQPGDKYCMDCHTASDLSKDPLDVEFVFADEGEIMYAPNYDPGLTTPLFTEKAPENFADGMVLTQDEIDNGEAVAVEGLSKAQLDSYWAAYGTVNAVVPQLILKEPSGSQADVLVAANWTNGVWTVEFTRKLVTGYEDDVQFSDLTRDYFFGVSLFNHVDLLGNMLAGKGGVLRFEQ